MRSPTLLLAIVASAAVVNGADWKLQYPLARIQPIIDTLHGVEVQDPYRWMENLDSPATLEWVRASDRLARGELDDAPMFAQLTRRLLAATRIRRLQAPLRRGSRYFMVGSDPGGGGVAVYLKEGENGSIELLVGERHLPSEHRLSASIFPSEDGKLLAYGFGRGSSRWLTLRVFDVDRKQPRADTLTGLHQTLPTIAWRPDSSGFYYARFPEPPSGEELRTEVERPRIMLHRLGTPQGEDVLIREDLSDPTRWFAPRVTEDGRYLLLMTGLGAAPENDVLIGSLARHELALRPLLPDMEGSLTYVGSSGDTLWFLTTDRAPRGRVIAVDVSRSDAVREVIPQSERTISYVNLVADRFIVFSTEDARPRADIFSLEGRYERPVDLPVLGTVWGPGGGGLGFVGRRTDREAFYLLNGLVHAGTVYRLDPNTGKSSTFHRPEGAVAPDDFVGEHVYFTSRDGTRVPMFIGRRKDVRPDGTRPVFMYAYGAGGWPAFPWYQPHIVEWMKMGGIYAMPGVRGGGEYGASWHQAGIKTRKQNGIDDYIAAAEWLLAHKYAAPGRLVANGGSLSSPLAAAAITQRPGLFGAAVIDISVFDLLRYDRFTGARMWRPELGSVNDAAEFRALLAYSPYHNVRDGACYPPTLVTAGSRDEIAVPSHSYKFVARLQHAQGCANPILLQVVEGAGHSFGTTPEQTADTLARQLTFLARVLRLDTTN